MAGRVYGGKRRGGHGFQLGERSSRWDPRTQVSQERKGPEAECKAGPKERPGSREL